LKAPPLPTGKKPLFNLSNRLVNKVGNGGFSLRKISSHKRWSFLTRFLFKWLPKNEDIIWSLFVPFKKPSSREALLFAFELQPSRSFELTNHQLPFGCHAWQKYEHGFWEKYIKKGY